MLRKVLLMSSVAALAALPVAFPAWAQEQAPSAQPTPLPAPAEQIEPIGPADPSAPAQSEPQAPGTGAIGEVAPEAVTPPPADAIIPAQAADEVRADALIGMNVYNANGDKVGQVKDILFNEDGQATGVVLSVGGVLGLGAKSVGLNWSEVDLRPDSAMVKVNYSKEQLEAAPDFQTQEAQQADLDAAAPIEDEQAPPASTGNIPLENAPASTE